MTENTFGYCERRKNNSSSTESFWKTSEVMYFGTGTTVADFYEAWMPPLTKIALAPTVITSKREHVCNLRLVEDTPPGSIPDAVLEDGRILKISSTKEFNFCWNMLWIGWRGIRGWVNECRWNALPAQEPDTMSNVLTIGVLKNWIPKDILSCLIKIE